MALNFTIRESGIGSEDGGESNAIIDLKPLGITFKRKLLIARWAPRFGGWDFVFEDSNTSDSGYAAAGSSWQSLGRTWDFVNGGQYGGYTMIGEYVGSKQFLKVTMAGNGTNTGSSILALTAVLIDPSATVAQAPAATEGIPPATVFDWGAWGAFND